mmetsp:Transcript_32895/g.27842  ORF Transcript_32895/g.27842 Transcript_32895/m.27842 type:complete len:173 (+) Transcript_32895:1127-1645(+)
MPCDLVIILDLHKEYKLKATEFFKQKAIGSDFAGSVRRILDKCKGIRVELEESNLTAFRESCDEVMGEIMEEIESSIDSGKIKSMEELGREFEVIEKNFTDNFPNVPQKKEIWLTYVTKWQGFAAEQLTNRSLRAGRDATAALKDQMAEALRSQLKLSKDKAEAEQLTTTRI